MIEAKELVDGNKYVLDAEFNNASIVTLVKHGKYFCTVRSDEGSEWSTMCYRLTEIPATAPNSPSISNS
jgi:hypothetical protein